MKPLMECTLAADQHHGNAWAYRTGCRCPDAREDHRLYQKRMREGRNQPRIIDGTGTRRRIRALVAIGWPAEETARRLHVDKAQVLRWYHIQRVHRDTAVAVQHLYDQLCWTVGPSWRSKSRAAKAGWAPPLAWDDDTIDDPAAEPEGVGFQPRRQLAEITHGRESGTRAHHRRGETPCTDCRDAARRAQADRRVRRAS